MVTLSRPRGFTLIELSVAGAISLIVVMGAFVWINHASSASTAQGRTTEIISQGRLVLDLIGREIREAGDSVQLLPAHCMGASQPVNPQFGCAAILDPHPWRITLARYAWGPGPDGIESTADDTFPMGDFIDDGRNVVTLRFVPRGGIEDLGPARRGYVGRIERVQNPFAFGGEAPRVDVLLDRVVLDDRMSASPDGAQVDHRSDFALFRYQIMSTFAGEYAGVDAYTQRTTREGSFLLPPMRFFALPADPMAWLADVATVPPYLPAGYQQEIVGLGEGAATTSALRPGKPFATDLRYVLDFNRIRAVRVSFKVAERWDDPGFAGGVDLDPERPGTAREALLESTFELKALASFLN